MNSDIIRLLPDSVANQIAAGEVIQRPASVIKELVENSVDAGASSIIIAVKDAGRTLIQVVDDGCGMSPTDARMAFERHATSKISDASDLFALHTMGFRGEALPSVAAVAQVDMRTRRADDNIGVRIQISGSKFEGQEPCNCATGTNLMVKNLFFHMPARRKYLKKDSTELAQIIREFEKLTLVNTDVDFKLIHNDITLHQFTKGTFKQRIIALFGKSMESQLAPIATETAIVKISGFVGLPQHARKRGYQQFFFVNGRNLKHPFFHKAVMKCYEHLIAADVQPSYFINFEVDPASIDVNIHPQKHEVKFEHEQAIFQILEACIRETLGKTNAVGGLDFDDNSPEIPLFAPDDKIGVPDDNWDERFEAFSAGAPTSPAADREQYSAWTPASPAAPRDWASLYAGFERARSEASADTADDVSDQEGGLLTQTESAMRTAEAAAVFQVHGRYVATPSRSGLMLINQHRAHIRILYERYLAQMGEGALNSQSLIFEEDLELPPNQSAIYKANTALIESLGFKASNTAGDIWCISAVPAVLDKVSPGEALQAVLECLADDSGSPRDELNASLALTMARKAAIPAGMMLTPMEMDTLVADLFRCASSVHTPDGLLITSIIGNEQIDSLFD